MKIKVNNNLYDIVIGGNDNIRVNGREVVVKSCDDCIVINGTEFHLDFEEEGDPSLMIINGMAYLVSKNSLTEKISAEVRAPISGQSYRCLGEQRK